MQATDMRTMCGKTLLDGIPNSLLRDKYRSGSLEDIENHLGETKLRRLGQLEK